MPVASMTGFARVERAVPGARLVWELRSVNGKTLELRQRLPPGLDGLEPELKRRAASRLSRGNVQSSLQIVQDVSPAAFSINRALLAEICAVTDELVRAGHAAPPSADGLLSLRGVIETQAVEPRAEIDDSLRSAALEAFEDALDALIAMRRDEGATLASALSRRLDLIEDLTSRAKSDSARRPEVIAERLRRQTQGLLASGEGVDPARLAQEAALLATRADIDEELDRLDAHLLAARALLASGEAVGRRLDFLGQEFHRESNTICSKSNAASLTAIGLELKLVVDQFREQVQNIE
mgnify:CR=1 FL=1